MSYHVNIREHISAHSVHHVTVLPWVSTPSCDCDFLYHTRLIHVVSKSSACYTNSLLHKTSRSKTAVISVTQCLYMYQLTISFCSMTFEARVHKALATGPSPKVYLWELLERDYHVPDLMTSTQVCMATVLHNWPSCSQSIQAGYGPLFWGQLEEIFHRHKQFVRTDSRQWFHTVEDTCQVSHKQCSLTDCAQKWNEMRPQSTGRVEDKLKVISWQLRCGDVTDSAVGMTTNIIQKLTWPTYNVAHAHMYTSITGSNNQIRHTSLQLFLHNR